MVNRSEFIWEEFVYGGHWLSIGSIGIILTTVLILNVSIKWEFLIIVYFGTQTIYNYNHHKEIEIDALTNPTRTAHLKKYHKYSKILLIIYGIGFFFLLIFSRNLKVIFFGFFLLLLGILFSYKIKYFLGKMIGAKLIYTSLSWGLLVPFTAIYHSFSLNISVFILFLFTCFRVVIITTFFDIKDIKIDKERNLLTLPVVFNKERSLDFLLLFNFISLIPIIIGVFINAIPRYSIFLVFLFFYSFYYIQKAKNGKSDIQTLSYIIVDGEFYYWPFLLFVGHLISSTFS